MEATQGVEVIRLDIINDGTGDHEVSDYDITLILPSEIHHAKVEGFARRQGWAALMVEAIDALEVEMHKA